LSLFGTDGIRGRFGTPPLDRETVGRIAAQLAATLASTSRSENDDAPPLVVLGGDTRESTPILCSWLAAGLRAGGIEVRYAGVIPTPGVAHLVRRLGAAAGVVVSASHNPYPDHGIKLFGPDGFKWSDEAEVEFEQGLATTPSPPEVDLPALSAEPGLRDAYLDALSNLAETMAGSAPLSGLRIVLDAGNGAASSYAAEIFQRLGAETLLLSAWPDGRNVNDGCGSTAPGVMAARVIGEKADLGAAFDGDADRCILADERGEVRDGDAILYLWATALHRDGLLPGGRIVATSMSNLGLERALEREGIGIVRCDVGDRWVVEALRRERLDLGGEQSGHIVSLSRGTTGDGLLTALMVAALRRRAGQPLSELLRPFRRYPQILLNVRVARREDLAALPAVAAARREVETSLGRDGRLVLRYSGTEPLARVMIEGPDQAEIDRLAHLLADAIRSEIGAGAETGLPAHA
jgi:phosphoglucosamine mutase